MPGTLCSKELGTQTEKKHCSQFKFRVFGNPSYLQLRLLHNAGVILREPKRLKDLPMQVGSPVSATSHDIGA